MGIGACSLGYADPDVNAAVKRSIDMGSMSTLNCQEEVQLAKMLTSLHPWAEMARFSRSGGEACSIAVRIARAATKKSKVLFCGYHGWHDWYLAANLEDPKNLDQQLLKGLSAEGVGSHMTGSAIPFSYNNLSQLNELLEKNDGDVAAIMMEPVRGTAPEAGFLEGVRNLANQFKVVLIFDEVTSGFRLNNGGVHMIYDVYPDLCVFGKALGNGFPISAVIGTGDVMSAAQSTFISSTFWTERVGFTAAIATLEKFAALKVWEHLQAAGEKVNEAWSDAATKTGVKIKISGIAPLTRIDFVSDYPALLQTLYTQEMLRRGYLAGSSIYSSYAYDDELLLSLPNVFEEVFTEIKAADEGDGCERALISEIKHTGFQRLT
jgi:glutamate-1-semialdehyde aminotransferase